MTKTALITGTTGQDGSYMAEFLLEKGYQVHGIKRRASSFNTDRIDHLINNTNIYNKQFFLHYGDMTDSSSLTRIIADIRPDEIYNLAAQSHVAVSFECPEYTANVDAMGTLRLLEAVRLLDLSKKTKIYQASTSELYGLVQETPQSETTPFYPRSPYAVAKLYAYWITKNYREAYDIFAANGILFNHESSRRGETFVTRKITRGLSRIVYGLEKKLSLGNLDSKRDWGHAKDYIEMQWRILQQPKADDFVIATGRQHTIRDFISKVASRVGIKLRYEGEGLNEVGVVENVSQGHKHIKPGDVLITINPRYFRPTEVESLLGDASKAHKILDWQPSITLEQMIDEMVTHDLSLAKKEYILNHHNLENNHFIAEPLE